jgi:hypothetical protein
MFYMLFNVLVIMFDHKKYKRKADKLVLTIDALQLPFYLLFITRLEKLL